MNALEYVQPPLARGISAPRTPEILLITFAKQNAHDICYSAPLGVLRTALPRGKRTHA